MSADPLRTALQRILDLPYQPRAFELCQTIAREALAGPSRTRYYDIWREGYAATGEHQTARFLGGTYGKTFEDAVRLWYDLRPDLVGPGQFDPATLTYRDCRHFDNEADARRSFG